MDTSIKAVALELTEHIRAHNVSNAFRERTRHGDAFVFVLNTRREPSRFERGLAWMREHEITNRAAFFEACDFANRSASLHHRCIKALVRSGEIKRVGREYIFVSP